MFGWKLSIGNTAVAVYPNPKGAEQFSETLAKIGVESVIEKIDYDWTKNFGVDND